MLTDFGNQTGRVDPLRNEGRSLAPADQVPLNRVLVPLV
jgi:hypothetical protein